MKNFFQSDSPSGKVYTTRSTIFAPPTFQNIYHSYLSHINISQPTQDFSRTSGNRMRGWISDIFMLLFIYRTLYEYFKEIFVHEYICLIIINYVVLNLFTNLLPLCLDSRHTFLGPTYYKIGNRVCPIKMLHALIQKPPTCIRGFSELFSSIYVVRS